MDSSLVDPLAFLAFMTFFGRCSCSPASPPDYHENHLIQVDLRPGSPALVALDAAHGIQPPCLTILRTNLSKWTQSPWSLLGFIKFSAWVPLKLSFMMNSACWYCIFCTIVSFFLLPNILITVFLILVIYIPGFWSHIEHQHCEFSINNSRPVPTSVFV